MPDSYNSKQPIQDSATPETKTDEIRDTAAVVGQAGEAIAVTRPAPGQTVEIQAAAGQTYVLSFPPGEAQVQVQGDNFILSFDDNGDGTPDSQVVFLDLVSVAQSSEGPAFQIAGVDIDSEVLLNQALALAGQDDVPLDDVAAGPGGLGGGATAYSDNLGAILDLLVAQGIIPPTELQFGLIDLEDEITLLAEDDTPSPEPENTPPEADPVLTPASQGELPEELQEALLSLLGGDGGEGGGLPDVIFFKKLSVDGDIGDDDTNDADFGGADAETALDNLVFTLQTPPAYGHLILVTPGGVTFLTVGDTFTSADTVWWVATESDIANFFDQGFPPKFLPDVTFDYSVTDENGASATAPVTITLPPPNPPTTTLSVEQGGCLKEDTEGSLLFNATPENGASKITQIVIAGFPTGDAADAWIVDDGSLSLNGLAPSDFEASYDPLTGELTITIINPIYGPVTGTINVTPNANSDEDAPLTIKASATNGSGSAESSPEASPIAVDAVVDGSEVEQTEPAVGDENTEIALNLQIDRGGDSTTGPGESQGGTDGDGSESITQVVVTLSAGELGWILAGPIGAPSEGPAGTWAFNTSGASLADVQALVSSLKVTPPPGFDGEINVTVTTTTAEAATEAGPNGASGDECDDSDNVDVDSYNFTVTVNPTVLPPEIDVQIEGNALCIKEDSSAEFDIVVSTQSDTDDVLNTVAFEHFQALAAKGWTVTVTHDGSGNLVDFTYTGDGAEQSVTFTITLTPPADSDLDVLTELGNDLSVSATAKDGSLVSDPTTVEIDVNIDAVADAVTVDIIVNDTGTPDGSFSPNETGTVRVIASFGDYDDGSETHTITVTIPAGFSVGALEGLPDGVTADVNGETGEITFTIGNGLPDFDYSFQVTAPETVSNEDSFQFHATARAEETNTPAPDNECSELDNVTEASDSQTLPGLAAEPTPVLVVGENVDDVEGESQDHRIKNPDGEPDGQIVGNDGDDVLIGDVGGSSLIGKTMNLALVLDTSDSMETEIDFNGETMTRIEALDKAVEQLLDNLANTPGATVRVRMISFGNGVKEAATFNIVVDGLVDPLALQAAKDFILAEGDNPLTVASGNTNYEAGFNSALNWFSNDANTLDEPDINQTIFISDGVPNRVHPGNANTGFQNPGSNQAAIDHVLGQAPGDNISEFDGLLGSFKGVNGTVDAIGINIGETGKGLLDQVDDDGDADNITSGGELVDVLDDLTQTNTLAPVGSDVIVGNGGDDVIFGDTIFTDDLAADYGISLPPGSGWAVIQQMIANGEFGPPSEVNANIIAFLRDPSNQSTYNFGGETRVGGVGRTGGHDTINGGMGNDTIFGQEGNDLIDGGSGDDIIIGGSGDDTMTGGSGSDVFRWTSATSDGEADVITDFSVGSGGDVLDLSGLLTGVPGGATAADLDAYLDFSFDGGSTTITVDFDGAGAGASTSTITLQGVDLSGSANQDIIQSLMDNGNLVT